MQAVKQHGGQHGDDEAGHAGQARLRQCLGSDEGRAGQAPAPRLATRTPGGHAPQHGKADGKDIGLPLPRSAPEADHAQQADHCPEQCRPAQARRHGCQRVDHFQPAPGQQQSDGGPGTEPCGPGQSQTGALHATASARQRIHHVEQRAPRVQQRPDIADAGHQQRQAHPPDDPDEAGCKVHHRVGRAAQRRCKVHGEQEQTGQPCGCAQGQRPGRRISALIIAGICSRPLRGEQDREQQRQADRERGTGHEPSQRGRQVIAFVKAVGQRGRRCEHCSSKGCNPPHNCHRGWTSSMARGAWAWPPAAFGASDAPCHSSRKRPVAQALNCRSCGTPGTSLAFRP